MSILFEANFIHSFFPFLEESSSSALTSVRNVAGKSQKDRIEVMIVRLLLSTASNQHQSLETPFLPHLHSATHFSAD